jgi:hypothetical protein
MSADRERVWEQLQALAERLLEHPKDLEPRDPIRLYNSLWRLWHYPASGPHRTLTVLTPGRKAPPGSAPLVREVVWEASRDHQRVFGEPAAGAIDPRPALWLRDAALPAEELRRLSEVGSSLAVPLLASARAANADDDLFGLETYEVSPFVRVQWRGAGPLPWRHFLDWVGELWAFLQRRLDEAN